MEQMSKEEFLKRCREDKEELRRELNLEIAYAYYKQAVRDGVVKSPEDLKTAITHIY